MTPVEIALEINKLYVDMKAALATEDGPWEGDYQALLSSLADAHTAGADALNRIGENADGMDGDDWEEVSALTGDAASDLRYLAGTLQSAANHAEAGQDWLAQTA